MEIGKLQLKVNTFSDEWFDFQKYGKTTEYGETL